jgi:hypothetical protein
MGVKLFETAVLDLQRFASLHLVAVAPLPLTPGQQVHSEHQAEGEDQRENDILFGLERRHWRTPSMEDVTPGE